MKTITCRQMGGPCDEAFTVETKDELMHKGMEHLEASHPEMAETVKTMPKDDPSMIEWQEQFDETWDNTPENAA